MQFLCGPISPAFLPFGACNLCGMGVAPTRFIVDQFLGHVDIKASRLLAIGRRSKELAHRASEINFLHIDCPYSVDLWDHGGDAGALVRHFWP